MKPSAVKPVGLGIAGAGIAALQVLPHLSALAERIVLTALADVRRDNMEGRGESWSSEDEEEFKRPIREQYETQGHPYYASARLWDDGIIDPAETRMVLGLSIAAALNAPIEPTRFGVFRM